MKGLVQKDISMPYHKLLILPKVLDRDRRKVRSFKNIHSYHRPNFFSVNA